MHDTSSNRVEDRQTGLPIIAAQAVRHLLTTLEVRRTRRLLHSQLDRLSDRSLADVGIERVQIDWLADRATRG